MQLWELDFEARTAVARNIDESLGPTPAGRFRWLDTSAAEFNADLLLKLAPGAPGHMADALLRELEFGEGWLAFGLTEPQVDTNDAIGSNVLFSHGILITLEFGRSETLAKLRTTWRGDFEQFARSSGFLLFELSDHYATVAQNLVHDIEARIEVMQLRLFGDENDDGVFGETALLIQRLLEFRKYTVLAQETFDELATRSSPFISATTQPFIVRNAVRMERLAAELLQQRDSLLSALNLYIGMTGHRTGQLLKRLTAFSMIFLPLSFMAGVFGMNFKYFPGLEWYWGYAMFWLLAAMITVALLLVARRGRWF